MLYWASEELGDDRFKQIAMAHADTAMTHHVRPDGSVNHIVVHDLETGEMIWVHGGQGFSGTSCWTRGEAWALYGYTMMFRESADEKYLQQAINVADMIIPYLPEDGVPYWDFNDPRIPEIYRDASAGAVMASAYIELSQFVSNKAKSKKYLKTAEKIIRTLASDEYLCAEGECHGFLLKHSVGNLPKNSEVDVPLTYADYYFLEALLRYRNLK